MTDHADTIRRALPAQWDGRAQTPQQAKITAKASAAHAALDALVAERQQAIDERDAAIKERDEWMALHDGMAADHYFARAEKAEARCEQAIDALREARPYVYGVMSDRRMNKDWRYETARDVLERVDAALVSLGEDKP